MSEEHPLPEIDAVTARTWMDAREAVLLDVREANEFEFENVPGSVLLPLSFLDAETFPPITDRKLIVMCAVGKRSAAAQKQLAESGIPNLYNLAGGIDAWKKAGFETQGGKFEALDFNI
jgi:rhodanese-related sulfurtransferase